MFGREVVVSRVHSSPPRGSRTSLTAGLVGIVLVMLSQRASAQARPSSAPALSPPPVAALPEPRAPSPWPELAALIPGVLLHGSGTWLQGRTLTSQRLLALEGVGLLGTFAS